MMPIVQETPEMLEALAAFRAERDVENRFKYHMPKEGQPERYQVIRAKALDLAKMLLATCPDSRERSQALVRLDEAVFWANASIARNE